MEQRRQIRRDPPSADCSFASKDPPSAYDNFIQNRRQRSKNDENQNGGKPHSTIRFSNNLEVYTKQPSNHGNNAATPKRSILRTNSKGNLASRKQPVRRQDSLLEKLQRTSQDQGSTDSSKKLEPPTGPARPRMDWNIESLFPSSDERKPTSRQPATRSRMVDLSGGIHTRVSKSEQYYSSQYLLNKYAAQSNGLKRPNVNGSVSPCSSPDSEMTDLPSPSQRRDNRYRGPLSDSKSNERMGKQRRLPTNRIGRKKELSYLQLDERNSSEDDPEFSVRGGYNLAHLIQRYPVESPKSSIASYDDILIRKNTSDTDFSDGGGNALKPKQFDWDDRDFHYSDSNDRKRIIKPWAIKVLVGAVCFCFASTLIIYLTMMDDRGGPSISKDNKIDVKECAHHNYTNAKFVSDRYNAIRSYLLFQSGGNVTMMDQPGSPQRQALCWMSELDGYNINATNGNEQAIIQRYSLAVLHFSATNQEENRDGNSGHQENSNFLSPLHECDWDGIICNHSREVTILRLSKKSFSGNIPPEIGNLISLNFIDFSLNQLTGRIPSSMARLTSLEYLSLAFNEFGTTIPTVLGQITSLNTLNLRSGQFLHEIPTDIGYLSNLELLLLDDNSLSGTIPTELGGLARAQQMNFRENNLSGSVPTELCELRNTGILSELEVDEKVDCECCT